jgi:small conductance mechanosensitive channel
MLDLLEKILVPKVYLPIIYIFIAIIINGIIKRIIDKLLEKKQKNLSKSSYNYKKTETFKVLVKNIIKYIIIIFLILAILTVYGIDVTSVLAGLGIVGVVIGLALQDLAKDIIAGVSIILENQYAIGDIISIGDFKGEVIFLGLKTTRIKNYEGQVKIIANRNATEVINYSMEDSLAIVDIDVSYEEDNDKVEKVLTNLAEELTNTLPKLKGKVELLGIQELSSSSVRYRIIAPTNSMAHFETERKIRKLVKERLDKEHIKIPYPQIEVHNGK